MYYLIRRFFPILALSLLFLSCQTRKDRIATQLNSRQIIETVTSKDYFDNMGSGFCSESLNLNSNHTFLFEHGCEGKSQITIGAWATVNDSIELRAIPADQFNLIANVTCSKNANRNQTTFIIVDLKGAPVANFALLPLKKEEQYKLTSNATIVVSTDGERHKMYETAENGIITIPTKNIDNLVLLQLQVIGNQKYELCTKDLPDTLKISLNINALAMAYGEVNYDWWDKPVKLRLEGSKLLGKYSLIEASSVVPDR